METLRSFAPPLFICDVSLHELEKKSKRRWKRQLHAIGIQVSELQSGSMIRVLELAERYRRPSRNDLFALALAEHLGAILVTGDRDLRKTAEDERCPVHGTLWLLDEMVSSGVLQGAAAACAVDVMLAGDRRIPAGPATRYQEVWRTGSSL